MSHEQTSLAFRENTVRALEDTALRAAMKQAADTFVINREREHTAQLLYALRPILLVEVNNDLSVAVGGKRVPAAFQFLA